MWFDWNPLCILALNKGVTMKIFLILSIMTSSLAFSETSKNGSYQLVSQTQTSYSVSHITDQPEWVKGFQFTWFCPTVASQRAFGQGGILEAIGFLPLQYQLRPDYIKKLAVVTRGPYTYSYKNLRHQDVTIETLDQDYRIFDTRFSVDELVRHGFASVKWDRQNQRSILTINVYDLVKTIGGLTTTDGRSPLLNFTIHPQLHFMAFMAHQYMNHSLFFQY